MTLITPPIWPWDDLSNGWLENFVEDAKKEEIDILCDNEIIDTIPEETEISGDAISPEGDTLLSMKEKLLISQDIVDKDKIEVKEKTNIDTKESKEKRNFFGRLFGKQDEEKGFPKFKKGLDTMVEAKILTPKEKELIEEELKDPEVRQSLKTRMAVRGTSIIYTPINSYSVAPLAGLLWWSFGIGIAVRVVLYLIKRLIVHWVVHVVWKNLKNRNHIENMSMIPLVWEHMALIDLFRTHPLTSKYFYAFQRTKNKQKKFINEENTITKETYRKELETSVIKKANWIEKRSNRLFKSKGVITQ